MTTEHRTDLFGREFKEGDIILYSPSNQLAEPKLYKVVGWIEKPSRYGVSSSTYLQAIPYNIEGFKNHSGHPNRVIILPNEERASVILTDVIGSLTSKA